MTTNATQTTDGTARVLGEYQLTPEEAAADENFRVLELPQDLVDHHLTATFTPSRYAKVCRDVAYFTSNVGTAPERSTGRNVAKPGSGMRRSKEGALYNLAHREALLSRAVDLGFISITNDDGFDAVEGEWRFAIQPRGQWYLHHYYGDHVPVRKVKTVQLSRYSAAKNQVRTVVDPETAAGAKSVEEWNEQVKHQHSGMGDVDSGYYHVSTDTVEDPGSDPAGESLVTWVDESNKPEQFNVDDVEGDVRVTCELEALAQPWEDNYTAKPVTIEREGDTGDLVIRGPTSRQPIDVPEASNGRLAVHGDYDPFVTSGAKDALKAATDAEWSDDYQRWYVTHDEFLAGVQAMLRDSEATAISAPAHVIHEYTEYL